MPCSVARRIPGERALVNAGFLTLGVAGHPEGHERIGATTLWNALLEKQEYAEVTGTRMHIVSQSPRTTSRCRCTSASPGPRRSRS